MTAAEQPDFTDLMEALRLRVEANRQAHRKRQQLQRIQYAITGKLKSTEA